MRTTVDIHEHLLKKARDLAARRGERLSDVINDLVAEGLARLDRDGPAERFVMPTFPCGKMLVDITDGEAMEAVELEDHRDCQTGKFDPGKMR